MHSAELEEEQNKALVQLVEASRSLPIDQRQPFYGFRLMGIANMLLRHPGIPAGHQGIYPNDLEELASAGLVRYNIAGQQTWVIDVTSQGFRYYEELKGTESARGQAVEKATVSYLELAGFGSRHTDALAKWREAERLLWAADTKQQHTVIGHLCREAMQHFATSLLNRCTAPSAPTDITKTVARIRAALGMTQIDSDGVRANLGAIVEYWGTVSDLAQRQEHGAQKEGTPLSWEDARRLVFQTVFVMVEVDRIAV
jgi:hypothetical protein